MREKTQTAATPLFSRQALTRLIIPLVIEQLLLMTVGMADTIMVTSTGEAAVSGVSLVDNLNILIIQIFAALSTGGAVVISQYLGRQEPENARTASRQLLYTVTAVSGVLMVFALVFRRQILALLFGQVEPAVMESALIYFLLTAAAYPFIAVYNAGASLFRSMGNSKFPMLCSFIINLINIVVNAVLIYGFDMGAAGAGVGTLVSRIAAALIITLLLRRPGCLLRLTGLFPIRVHWRMVRRILTVGIPNGLENGMFQAGKLLVLNLITSFGTTSVAANAIVNSIASVIIVPGLALGLAMITVIGQCMGARDAVQAVRYTRILVGLSYLCIAAMSTALFFVATPLTSLFHLSPEAEALAIQVLRGSCLFHIVFWPTSFTLPNALRASGDAVFTMAISLTSMFLCRVLLSYVFASKWGLGMGLQGVWLAMYCDWIFRSTFFLIRFLRGKWKRIRLI